MKHFLKMIMLCVVALAMLGCDVIEKAINAPPKGSLDAVILCMEENADKEKLIGEYLIKRQCTEKHQLFESNFPSETCVASVHVNPKGISSIEPSEECINTTDRIITAINGSITVKNLSSDIDGSARIYSETAGGTLSWTWINPEETLHRKIIRTEHEWSEQVKDNVPLPFCSKKPEELCMWWEFTGYHYLKTNI
jgi:ethanolamine utilization microcompartment shell protein EutS